MSSWESQFAVPPCELPLLLQRAHAATAGYRKVLSTISTEGVRFSDAAFFRAARMEQDVLLDLPPKDIYSFEEVMDQYLEMQWLTGLVNDFERQVEMAGPWFNFREPSLEVARVYMRSLLIKRNESPVEAFKANVKVAEQLYTNSDELSLEDQKNNIKEEKPSKDDLDELSMEHYPDDIKPRVVPDEPSSGSIKREYKEEDDGFEYSLTSLTRRLFKRERSPEIEESDPEEAKRIKLEYEPNQGNSKYFPRTAQRVRQGRYAQRGGQAAFEEGVKQEVKQEAKQEVKQEFKQEFKTEIRDAILDMADVDLDLAKDLDKYKNGWHEIKEEKPYDAWSEDYVNESKEPSEDYSQDNPTEDQEDEDEQDGGEEVLEDTSESLRAELIEVCRKTLPEAASKNNWPVQDEQSFQRIIFRTAMPYVEEPALEALNEEQLRGCVWFAKLIQRGAVDLAKLNKQSLALEENSKPRRKGADNDIAVPGTSAGARTAPARKAAGGAPQTPTTAALLSRIARSSQTAFQKRTLSALLQIPRGHHTTYAILARHLKSSPRAVGNALGANPFAPHVPCHRVLASDGGIGGFKGVWGRHGLQGANDDEKRRLLRSEGVVFDARGRALGSSWEAFR